MMKRYNLPIVFILACFLCNITYANTFVGNGGSAGDIELLITKKQIVESMKAIKEKNYSIKLCECSSSFSLHKECQPLKSLNEDQVNFCKLKTQKVSTQIINLLEKNSVRFNWTKNSIFVRDDNKTVYADAVADPSANSVTIDQNRFLKMPQTQRLFLLTHELVHLISDDGNYLDDSGSIGPYKGNQGKRNLINSVAATAVIVAHNKNVFNKHRKILRRTDAYKSHWLELNLSGQKSFSSGDNIYYQDSFVGLGLKYKRYFKNNFGFSVGYRSERAREDILSNSEITENISILSFNLLYRMSPFSDPLTSFGQSFFSFEAGVESFRSDYELKDNVTGGKWNDSGVGYALRANYHYPMSGFWIVTGLGLNQRSYEHQFLNLDYDSINLLWNIGVSRAF